MFKVCVMTGSRADYGLLKNTITRLSNASNIELKLMVSGTHFDKAYGETVNEIIEDGFTVFDRIEVSECRSEKDGMAKATGEALIKYSEYLMKTNPDVIVVLGDRYEAFALCSAATMMGISIAHISGGDITEGAIDDTLRHCMTKMSQLHFTGCEQSRKRVIQLGENPDYVYNVGEPGVENALHEELMTRESLAENLGFDGINNDYALVTFHPATKDVDTDEALRQLEELLCAIKAVNELSYVVTLANADTGGNLINERWLQFEKECDNVKVFSSLGMKRYLSAMKYCSLVLGNSSSGIVEAPAFSVPTVNIGNRQTGRMMSESVICCDTDNNQIVSSIKRALDPDFKKSIIGVESCFGDGNTSKQIVDILVDRLNNNSLKYIKSFHDIQFE